MPDELSDAVAGMLDGLARLFEARATKARSTAHGLLASNAHERGMSYLARALAYGEAATEVRHMARGIRSDA